MREADARVAAATFSVHVLFTQGVHSHRTHGIARVGP